MNLLYLFVGVESISMIGKLGRWSDMSYIMLPLSVWCRAELKKMLSMVGNMRLVEEWIHGIDKFLGYNIGVIVE